MNWGGKIKKNCGGREVESVHTVTIDNPCLIFQVKKANCFIEDFDIVLNCILLMMADLIPTFLLSSATLVEKRSFPMSELGVWRNMSF